MRFFFFLAFFFTGIGSSFRDSATGDASDSRFASNIDGKLGHAQADSSPTAESSPVA